METINEKKADEEKSKSNKKDSVQRDALDAREEASRSTISSDPLITVADMSIRRVLKETKKVKTKKRRSSRKTHMYPLKLARLPTEMTGAPAGSIVGVVIDSVEPESTSKSPVTSTGLVDAEEDEVVTSDTVMTATTSY